MKIKIALGIGWFGVLTPLMAFGGVMVLWYNNLNIVSAIIVPSCVASAINFFMGYKILKRVAAERAKV